MVTLRVQAHCGAETKCPDTSAKWTIGNICLDTSFKWTMDNICQFWGRKTDEKPGPRQKAPHRHGYLPQTWTKTLLKSKSEEKCSSSLTFWHQPDFNVCISSVPLAEGNICSLLPDVEGFPQDDVHLLPRDVWRVPGHPVAHPPRAPLRSFKCKTLPSLLPRSCVSLPPHLWQCRGTLLFWRGENYWRSHSGWLHSGWEGGWSYKRSLAASWRYMCVSWRG